MALIGTMMVSSMGMVFADEKSVPAHINVPATAIDYSVTEKINMTGAENSTDLTIDSLNVTNNLKAGVLNIDSVEATGDNGWTVVGDDSDFVKMGKNAHKFSMVADGTFDMSTGVYTTAGQVNPGEKDTTAFTGQTGITTEAITDEKAANVVVTVSLAKGAGAGEEIQYEALTLKIIGKGKMMDVPYEGMVEGGVYYDLTGQMAFAINQLPYEEMLPDLPFGSYTLRVTPIKADGDTQWYENEITVPFEYTQETLKNGGVIELTVEFDNTGEIMP